MRPHQPRIQGGTFDGSSSYQRDFTPKITAMTPHAKAKNEYTPTQEPFLGSSVTKADFISLPLNQTVSVRPLVKRETAPPPTDYHTSTHDHKDFGAVLRVPPCLPRESREEPGLFEGSSSYSADFKGVTAPRVGASKPKLVSQVGGSRPPMDTQPTSRTDYGVKPLQKTISCKPQASRFEPGKFDGTTTALLAFQAPSIEPRASYKPSPSKSYGGSVPFEGSSTAHQDFQAPLSCEPAVSKKPLNSYTPSTEPLAAVTTQNQDFIMHNLAEARRAAIRPSAGADASSKVPGNFCTTYQQDMRRHEPGERTEAIRPKASDVGPSASFEGISDYRASYVAQPMQRTQPCKPMQTAIHGGPAKQGRTTAQDDYTAHVRQLFVLQSQPLLPAIRCILI